MAVTLRDLSIACGLSVGTVSRALNGKSEVSLETTKRVCQLAQELGYIPNRAGRALAFQRTPLNIGVILPSVNNAFFDELKEGLIDKALKYRNIGLQLYLKETEGRSEKEQLLALQELKAHGCNGFALCLSDTPQLNQAVLKLAEDTESQIVLLNSPLSDCLHLPFIGPHYRRSGVIAAALMDKSLEKGKERHVLVIVGSQQNWAHMQRVTGFISECQHQTTKSLIVEILEGHDSSIVTQRTVMDALKQHPDIDSIYIATGMGVAGLGAALIAEGKTDLFVVACDETFSAKELMKSDIIDFSICQNLYYQGELAISKLQEALSTNNTEVFKSGCIMDEIIKLKYHFLDLVE